MSFNPSEEKPWVEMSRYGEKQDHYSANLRRPEHFGLTEMQDEESVTSYPNRVDRVTTSSSRMLYSTSGQKIPLKKTSSVLTSSYIAALPANVQTYLSETAQFVPPQAISMESGRTLPSEPYKTKPRPPLFQHVKSSSSRVPTFKTSSSYFHFKDHLNVLPPLNTDGAIEKTVHVGAVPVRADLQSVQNGNTSRSEEKQHLTSYTAQTDFMDRQYSANGMEVKFSTVLGTHKKVLSVIQIFHELEEQLDQNFSLLGGSMRSQHCPVQELVDWCKHQKEGSLRWMLPWLERGNTVGEEEDEQSGLPPPEQVDIQKQLMLCIGKGMIAVGKAYDTEHILNKEERHQQLVSIQGILEILGKMVVTCIETVFRKHQVVVRKLQATIKELRHNTPNVHNTNTHKAASSPSVTTSNIYGKSTTASKTQNNHYTNNAPHNPNTHSSDIDVNTLLMKNIDEDQNLPVSSSQEVERFHKQHNNTVNQHAIVPYKENKNIRPSNLLLPQSTPTSDPPAHDYTTALLYSSSQSSTLLIDTKAMIDKDLQNVDHPMLPTLISTHRNLLKSQKYEMLKKISTLEEENTMLREVLANRGNELVVETALYDMGAGVMTNLRSLTGLLNSLTSGENQRVGLLSEQSNLIRSTTVAHDYTKNLESLGEEEVRARTITEVGRLVEAERRDFRKLKFGSYGYDSAEEFGTNMGHGKTWQFWKPDLLPVEQVELNEDDGVAEEIAPRGILVEAETICVADTYSTSTNSTQPTQMTKRDKVLAELLFEKEEQDIKVNVNGLHWFLEHLLSRMNACKGEDAIAVMSITLRRTLRQQEKNKSCANVKDVKKQHASTTRKPVADYRIYTAPSRRASVTYIKMQRGKVQFSSNEELPHHQRRLGTSVLLRSLMFTYNTDLAPHTFTQQSRTISKSVANGNSSRNIAVTALLQFLHNVFILHAVRCTSLPADALPLSFMTTLYSKILETVTADPFAFKLPSVGESVSVPLNPLYKVHSTKKYLESYTQEDTGDSNGNTHLNLVNVAAIHKPKARRDLEIDALLRKNLVTTERVVAGICRDILGTLEIPSQPTILRCQVLAYQEMLGLYVEENPGDVNQNIVASLAGHIIVEAQTVGRFNARMEETDLTAATANENSVGDEQRFNETKTMLTTLHQRCMDPIAAPLLPTNTHTVLSSGQLQNIASQNQLVPSLQSIASARTLFSETESIPKRSFLTNGLDEPTELAQIEAVLSRIPCHVAVKAQHSWVQSHGLPIWVWMDSINSLITYTLRGFTVAQANPVAAQSIVLMLVDTMMQQIRRNTHLAVLLPILNEAALKTPGLRNSPLSADVQTTPVGCPMDAIIRNILSKQYQGTGTVVKERLLRLLGTIVQLHHCLEYHNSRNMEQREHYSRVGVDMSLVILCGSAAIRKWTSSYNRIILQKFNALSKFNTDTDVINKEQFAQLLISCDRKFSQEHFHHMVQYGSKFNSTSAVFTPNKTFFPIEQVNPPVLTTPVQSATTGKNTTVLEPEVDVFTVYSVLATCTYYRIGCECAYGLGRSDVTNRNASNNTVSSKQQKIGQTTTMLQQLCTNILQGYKVIQTKDADQPQVLPTPISFLCLLRLQTNDITAEINCMQTLQYYRERVHKKNEKAKQRAAVVASSEEIPMDTLVMTNSLPIVNTDPEEHEKTLDRTQKQKTKISNPFTASKDGKDINLE